MRSLFSLVHTGRMDSWKGSLNSKFLCFTFTANTLSEGESIKVTDKSEYLILRNKWLDLLSYCKANENRLGKSMHVRISARNWQSAHGEAIYCCLSIKNADPDVSLFNGMETLTCNTCKNSSRTFTKSKSQTWYYWMFYQRDRTTGVDKTLQPLTIHEQLSWVSLSTPSEMAWLSLYTPFVTLVTWLHSHYWSEVDVSNIWARGVWACLTCCNWTAKTEEPCAFAGPKYLSP